MDKYRQHPSYVQHSFSARKIVENNECRTSNHRAQHEAKRDLLNINGKVSPQSFFIELFFSCRAVAFPRGKAAKEFRPNIQPVLPK